MDANEKENKLDIYAIPSPIPEDKKINTNRKWYQIDKEMLRFKVHYFFFSGGLGIALPYLTVFAKNRIGISASGVAAIITTDQFLFIFTKPLMGYLADYFNKLKIMIFILNVIPMLFLFLLLPIPKINIPQVENNFEKYSWQSTDLKYKDNNLSEICQLYQENNTSSSSNSKSKLICHSSTETLKFDNTCFKITLPQYGENTTLKSNSTSVPYQIDYASLCFPCCNTTKECHIFSCQNVSINAIETISEVSEFETYQFWAFAMAHTMANAAVNALFTLSDTACCESIAKTGAEFGRQRVFGAVGWGTMAPLGGLLHDYTKDYLFSWIIMALMLTVSLWNISKINLVQPQFSKNVLKDVGKVLSSTEFLTFEFGVLMNGIGCGIIWFYLIWFLTTIGASGLLCGLVLTVQCFVGQLPFMFYSGWFIKKLGHFNVLTFALAAYCARFFFYSCLYNPWLILPMEVVHGFTYGIYYPAVASFAKLSAKPGTEATTQSILFSTHEGLGAGIGCVIAGLGFDNFGGHETFFHASIFCGCGMLVNIAFTLWNRRQRKSIGVTPPNAK